MAQPIKHEAGWEASGHGGLSMFLSHLNKFHLATLAAALLVSPRAHALNLDWSGYFRADHNHVRNIVGESERNATFSTVFMKLRPRVLVNDNVIIHSEWDVGDQVAGFFGTGVPREDRSNPFSVDKSPFPLGVNRLWLDVHTDFGTLQVGRAPFHWGLGAFFNAGDRPSDRFQSTMDTIRLVSKFGNLSVMPLYAKSALGRSLGGARNPLDDKALSGSDDVSDYGVGLRYDSPEEELEGGALFYKRSAGDAQNSYYVPDPNAAPNPATPNQYVPSRAAGMSFRIIDLYAKKSWRRVDLAAEIPILSGTVPDYLGNGTRNEFAATGFALEAALKYETWRHTLKLGTVPGQTAGDPKFGALSFHRAYKLGLILFNYNLGGFGAANIEPVSNGGATQSDARLVNPYDAAISNAKYVMFSSEKRWEQWSVNAGAVWAQANQASVAGKTTYNSGLRRTIAGANATDQGNSYGLEIDLGARYSWDDNISFGLDLGALFAGDYLKQSGVKDVPGTGKSVFAGVLSAATTF